MNKNKIKEIVNVYLTKSVEAVHSKYCWFEIANYYVESISEIYEPTERPDIVTADVWICVNNSGSQRLIEVEIDIKTDSVINVYPKFKSI